MDRLDRLNNAFKLLKQHYSHFKILDYYLNDTDQYIAYLIVNYGDNIEIIEKPKFETVVVFYNGKVVKMKTNRENV